MIFWATRGDRVLLVRRPDRGLLGGMRALPTGPWADAPPGLADPPAIADWQIHDVTVSHVFTHFRLDLRLASADIRAQEVVGEWWRVNDLDSAGLPTVFAKAAAIFRRH
jgi:A/G-specific adenine glycosylase